MGLDLAQVPEWPDFAIERMSGGSWRAMTNTGRPRTPIFNVWVGQQPNEETARAVARRTLDKLYAQAHPNGCPGSH